MQDFKKSLQVSATRLDFNLILILTVPFVMLAFNDEWLFPYGNPSDAWINVSFYLNDAERFPELYTTYKASRVMWYAKGIILNRLIGDPLIAHYVLHIGMFLAILTSFYYLIAKVLNKHTALASTLALAVYSQFHAVVSFEWDYQTHDGILHIFLTMLVLLQATRSKHWPWWLLLAGGLWSIALQTIYMATYMLAVVFWYLFLNYRNQRNPIFMSGVYIFIGAVVMTILSGFVSLAFGGRFFFLMNVIGPSLIFGFSGGFNYHPGYWFPLSYLLQNNRGIILPTMIFLLAIVKLPIILLRSRPGAVSTGIVACLGVGIVAVLSALPIHLIGHGQLSNDHIIAYIIPFMFVALAGLFGSALRTAGMTIPQLSIRSWAVKLAFYAIFVGSLVYGQAVYHYTTNLIFASAVFIGFIPDPPYSQIGYAIYILVAAFIAFFTLWAFANYRQAAVIWALFLALFVAEVNLNTSSIGIYSYGDDRDCSTRKEAYLTTIDTYLKLQKYQEEKQVRLWYKKDEFLDPPHPHCKTPPWHSVIHPSTINMTSLYGAILGLMGYTVIPTGDRAYNLLDTYLSVANFRNISQSRVIELPKSFFVALLSDTPEDHKIGLETLRSQGFRSIVVEEFTVQNGPVTVRGTVIDATKDARFRAENRIKPIDQATGN